MVPGSHGGIVRRTERTGRRDDAKTKRQAGKSWRQKKELNFFVENVPISYILQSRIYQRSNKTMFINSQVGLLSPEKLANSAVPAGGLSQASGLAGGTNQSTGAVFGGLIGAAVSALSERHLAGVKTSLVIAAIGGLAWLIATAFFAAGELLPT
jgi:hypothetical protein